jgi:hypothetical protein
MEQFDIVGQLYRNAKANGWVFLAGDDYHQNVEATKSDYAPNQLVLGVKLDANPITIHNGVITEIRYTGVIRLGLKVDNDGTYAGLDELFMDKYTKRMLMLTRLLSEFVGAFACENKLEVSNYGTAMDLYRTDEAIDFVEGMVTFVQ